MEATNQKSELIERIIYLNKDVINWGWDRMGVYDIDYESEKFSGQEIYENKYDKSFMRDVARDYFHGIEDCNEIIIYCDQNSFEY